jgi:hypothetical protein
LTSSVIFVPKEISEHKIKIAGNKIKIFFFMILAPM